MAHATLRAPARDDIAVRMNTPMRFDHFTVKSQEALERAQRRARDHGHPELAPEHLLAALPEAAGEHRLELSKKL